MTSKRAKLFIALIWTCSSLISFPAIIWWRLTSPDPAPGQGSANSHNYECLFTEDIGYLVFSSVISFYGPLIIMIFFYYKIYRAATDQSFSINVGSKQVKMKNSVPGKDGDYNPVVLRIHRGRFCPDNASKSGPNCVESIDCKSEEKKSSTGKYSDDKNSDDKNAESKKSNSNCSNGKSYNAQSNKNLCSRINFEGNEEEPKWCTDKKINEQEELIRKSNVSRRKEN